MVARRRSQSELPNAPLELLHPLLLPGADIPGAEIVREIGGGDGATLLELLRAVLAWSAHPDNAPALESASLARTEYELLSRGPDPFASPAGLLAGYMASAAEATQRDVSWACVCLSDWAAERGAKATALQFAQAAALAWPHHPRYAWLFARMLRGHGRMREAETWFTRAYRVAAWVDDRVSQAKSLASLGVISYITGNYVRADRRLQRALKVAVRYGLKLVEGEVLHDLFVLEMERRQLPLAEEYATRALECYLPRHERIPALAHDTACLWMAQGYFARAYPLLRAVIEHVRDPAERFQTYSAMARAAGGCNHAEEFERAWTRAFEIADVIGSHRVRAAALLDLGRGAASLCRWDKARAAFSEALSVAWERGEGDVQLKAEAGLDSVNRHSAADAAARKPKPEYVDYDEVAELLLHGIRHARSKEPSTSAAPSTEPIAA